MSSANPIVWRTDTDTAKKLGWFIDLPTAGERQVSDSLLRGGQVIFTTLIPSEQPCDFGGSSWLMELDASSGSRLSLSPFDLNHDVKFNQSDSVQDVTVTEDGTTQTGDIPPSGIAPTDPGIFWTPLIVSQITGIPQFKYMSESTSAIWNVTENPGSAGRQTWRQIQ